ncbi:MAG: hypothetical protein ACD_10C00905G0002 [uncultured bacterium]|nr:MAG: hypothetical protein ACD_10C00905G0002 [uncultured bacterium]
MGFQRGSAFVKRDGLFQGDLAAFQLGDDGFEGGHGLFEGHIRYGFIGHRPRSSKTPRCAATEAVNAGRS